MLKSVAIVGSCQIGGVGYALKSCAPGLDVRFINPVNASVGEAQLIADALTADAIVTQNVGRSGLHAANLSKLHPQVHYLPMLVFRGFHPDCVQYKEGQTLTPGVLAVYHSVIASSCYALGLPESQTVALFNTLVFRSLGYFDVFENAKAQTVLQFEQSGYDIGAHFGRWMQFGQFMYTPNHPRIEVLMQLGEMLALKLGIHTRELTRQPFKDNLGPLGMWPLYREIAKAHRVPATPPFAFADASGAVQEATLAAMVAASYRLYSTRGRENMLKLAAGPRLEIMRRLLRR